MEEVCLLIEEQQFKVKKELLCKHSDYFRAMFSGRYKEEEQTEIQIDIVDAESMKKMLNHMSGQPVNLSDVSSVGDLVMSASFLQISELVKHIEDTLDAQIALDTWAATLAVAESASLSSLAQRSAAFGLLSFDSMQVAWIPTLPSLLWYLSHPYLACDTEMQVFKFGMTWIQKNDFYPMCTLAILGCLDVFALSCDDLEELGNSHFIKDIPLANGIVSCLLELKKTCCDLSAKMVTEIALQSKYTKKVYLEVEDLIISNKKRLLEKTPCVPAFPEKSTSPHKSREGMMVRRISREMGCDHTFSLVDSPQFLYRCWEDGGLQRCFEVAEGSLWGWSVAAWGQHRLVVVGGELRRGSGVFNRDVRVWDVLRQRWSQHGVALPSRRHAGIAIYENTLYLVGGVGTFRVVLSSAIAYDLESRTYRKLADLPEIIQNPATAVHLGQLLVAGHRNIYRLESDWRAVLDINIRPNYLVSHQDRVFVTQGFFNHLYCFKPDIDDQLHHVADFQHSVTAMCSTGKELIAFTEASLAENSAYVERHRDGQTEVVWSDDAHQLRYYGVAGCCTLVLAPVPVHPPQSPFPLKHIHSPPAPDANVDTSL